MSIKIVQLNEAQFNSMSKDSYYRQIEQAVENTAQVQDWMDYRGTPSETVYRFDRETGIVWRVKV